MQKKESTDWTKYYNKPKSRFSIITQKITLKYIMDIIKEVGMVGQWTIMECGGGNSCFAGSVVEDLDIAQYDIIDKCEVSVEKADEKDVIAHTYCLDLTEKIETENIIQSYDFVYSVGLVEHFSDTDRQKVIANHFELCKPDGYVLITAPTPTFKYRFIRKCMEILHVWQFWDERPIALEKLVKELGTYGEIMHAGVNKKASLDAGSGSGKKKMPEYRERKELMSIHNGIVIIPVLNPGYNLINLVRVIKQSGFEYVVIVNDGSSEEYNDIFAEVSKQQGVTILRHCVNLGKGRALKTAINFVINEYPKCVGVITVDADGQHTIKDIQAMNKALLQYQGENKIILGCRTFEDTDELKVPLRSKIGNVCTKYIMRYLCNLKVSDTQTGLRAIPRQYLPKLVETAGERYEYETNMLLQLTTGGAQITEIPINTVYEGQNEVSHFHPLRDSWMIYKTIIAYSLSSMLSVVVDNLLFIVLLPYINNVWILTFIGRAAAALVNFTVNRNVVFKKRDHVWNTFLKYILLVLLSGTVSAFAVSKISSWMGDISIIVKICVESVLYFFNYYIQKNFVFIKKQNREDGA